MVGALRLGDGRIVVADGGSFQIRVYDPSGRFVRSMGGRGSGPDEFQQIAGISRAMGDSIAVWDGQQMRLTMLPVDGSPGRSVTGRGRFDHPRELSPVLYLAETPDHAVGELLQAWCGRPLQAEHLVRAGLPMALTEVRVPDAFVAHLADLCAPEYLAAAGVRPDTTASRRREPTQQVARVDDPEEETMSSIPRGRFTWYELMTTDPAAAPGFYEQVAGWGTMMAAYPQPRVSGVGAGRPRLRRWSSST